MSSYIQNRVISGRRNVPTTAKTTPSDCPRPHRYCTVFVPHSRFQCTKTSALNRFGINQNRQEDAVILGKPL
ncbi:hypothetical protein L873DRAFT_1820996 [Choiromyces venosus 120613-1]|uniref:Uncharacterized protein n=1 Tax=Choiromyces venosus 120613-1 TaxID=1336337 RepID=A0A3N4IWX5_9PEZI|nr:hypothetical protein L873DRAFT_1820996 [Choiromyces venosus 120613-1]